LSSRQYRHFLSGNELHVTITAPPNNSTVTDAAFKYTWITDSLGTQVSFRLRIYTNTFQTVLLHDSGIIYSAGQTYQVPVGALDNPDGLSLGTYFTVIDVIDNLGASGNGTLFKLIRGWSSATSLVALSIVAMGDCGQTGGQQTLPGLQLRWTQPTPGASEAFIKYAIYRREPLPSATYPNLTPWTHIQDIASIATTTWTDYEVRSGVTYQYRVFYVASVGIETRISDAVTNAGQVKWDWLWLHQQEDPTNQVCFFSFSADEDMEQDIDFKQAWGRQSPTARIGDTETRRWRVTGEPLVKRKRWDELVALISAQRTEDALVVARFGRARVLAYCQVISPTRNIGQKGYAPAIQLVEVNHTVGV